MTKEIKKIEKSVGIVLILAQGASAVFILYSVGQMMIVYEGLNGFGVCIIGGGLALAMILVQAFKVMRDTAKRVSNDD